MDHALAGEQGIITSFDHRQRHVVTAYGPLLAGELGVEVKIDSNELYQPIRLQLQNIFPFLLGLLLLGIALVRWQITPLMRRVVRSERQLQETNLMQHAILDSANFTIISTDPEGVIRTFNKTAERLLGYTADEVVGKKTPGIIHDPAEMVRRAEALSRELGVPIQPGLEVFITKPRLGMVDENEWSYIRKDGSRFPVLLSITALRNAENEITGYMGIASDISARNQAAAELNRFKNILDDTLDMIFMFEPDSLHFVYTSRGAIESMGYGREELLQMRPYDIEPLMPEPEMRAFFAPLIAGDKPSLTFETQHRRKDGTDFPVEVFLQFFKNPGEQGLFIAIVRDITERKQAESTLRDSETRIRAILDTVVDGIVTINHLARIESFNPAAERLFGYRAEEVIGQNVNILMPEPYHSEHDGYVGNYIKTKTPKIIGIGREVTGKRKDGSQFPMDLAVSSMILNNQRYFTGIIRDITERKKIDLMKSEFISTVSHELRTPLTAIRGSLGLLSGGAAGLLPDQAADLAQIALKNSERLARLINDILDIEKIESGKMEFNMHPVKEHRKRGSDSGRAVWDDPRVAGGPDVLSDAKRETKHKATEPA